MKEENNRYNHHHHMPDYCTLGAATGPQTIIVRQVLGETETQDIIDLHVRVPHKKPSIEQIVDVFVKNVEVNSVDVIADRVMVRGEFEVKAIYVACLPDQPVHAVEIKHCKFLQDVDIPGARRGMDAEATVGVEFVDYDVPEMTRAYKYKYHGDVDDDGPMYDDDPCDPMEHHHHMDGPCDPMHHHHMDDPCDPMEHHHHMDDCGHPQHHHHPMPPYDPAMACCPPKGPNPPGPPCAPCCEEICFREFDVSIMLRIKAKVMADREVQVNPQANMTSGAATAQPVQPAPAPAPTPAPAQPAQTLPSTPKG